MNYATYSPEDNKLRLYVGRVPRDEYEQLRKDGWTSTPKQSCDFVAVWTPSRRDTALSYCEDGVIEDEDQTAEDRAADRAERFGGYRDKRLGEAVGEADTYDAGPSSFGFQSQARAERAASRHDRIAGRAVDSWGKAEYWQQRTAGVIAHALYVSSPGVRMGRIKTIEAEQRKHLANLESWHKTYSTWVQLAAIEDPAEQTALVKRYAGCRDHNYDYKHPRPETVSNPYIRDHGSDIHTLMTLTEREYGTEDLTGAEACAMFLGRYKAPRPIEEDEWNNHFNLRLAYENQMLEAQGGRAAFVEMEVGGWIGNHQIRKVNKSPETGRVVSVTLKIAGDRWGNSKEGFHLRPFNIERLPSDAYRAPSEEDKAALANEKKKEKAAAPKKEACPLVNPTDEDAQRLQDALNEHAKADYCKRHIRAYGSDYASDFKPSTVCRITQARYSEVSKGAYARAETRGVCRNAEMEPRESNMWSARAKAEQERRGPAVCQVRSTGSDGSDYGARRVIVLTDKPQKPLPAGVWALPLVTA